MITVSHLSKRYNNNGVVQNVLKDINCTISKGEVISVIGPSGAGKSTFLRCLNRIEVPTSGNILVNGVNILDGKTDICKVRRKVGMVFQNYNLFENLNVIDNVTLGPRKLLHIDKAEAERQGMEHLRAVGLAEKALAMPSEMSGGQIQRAAIARCLAMKPDVLLLDEPTSALDPTMVSEVLSVIRKLAKEGHTMVITTHEMSFARDVSSRIFFLFDGVIYEEGTPEQIFDHPQKTATQIFINKIKSIEFSVVSRDYDLYQMNGKIEYFCHKYSLVDKINTMELLLEEFLANILPHGGKISIIFNFSEKDYCVTMEICQSNCAGPILDAPGTDEISVMLVRGLCASIVEEQMESGRRIVAKLK